MLKRLKRRFVLLYTVSAGTVVLVMLVMIYMWNANQQMQEERERFLLQMDHVTYELRKSVMFNSTCFQQMESSKHLMMCFEEKGKRLRYINNYGTEKERERLFAIVREKAEKENVFLNINPRVLDNMKSAIFQLKGDSGKRYLGQAVVLPNPSGWNSIILIQDVSGGMMQQKQKLAVYGSGGVVSILFLFFFSYWFVKKTMKPVEEAQIKQNEFVAAASHELKSPLAVIQTCATAITLEDEQQKEFIIGIQNECSRMSKLIQDLLLLASTETRSWKIRMETFALDEFLIQEYDGFSLLASNKKQELILSLPEDMEVMVCADRNRLLQVLTILVDNAVSYAPEHSKIEIGLVREKRHLLLSVIDHGIGISDMEKKQIFDRFYRGDKARNDKSHYGLGLSIGYELVQRMGAALKVTDTSGGGATFVIDFFMAQKNNENDVYDMKKRLK